MRVPRPVFYGLAAAAVIAVGRYSWQHGEPKRCAKHLAGQVLGQMIAGTESKIPPAETWPLGPVAMLLEARGEAFAGHFLTEMRRLLKRHALTASFPREGSYDELIVEDIDLQP